MAEKTLLRRCVLWRTNIKRHRDVSHKAAQFTTMSKYNIRLGRLVGLEKPFRFYTLRRGAGHAINSEFLP